MRINNTNFAIIGGLGGEQTMVNIYFYLTNTIKVGGGEKVIDLGDGAFQRIFHRHHAQV